MIDLHEKIVKELTKVYDKWQDISPWSIVVELMADAIVKSLPTDVTLRQQLYFFDKKINQLQIELGSLKHSLAKFLSSPSLAEEVRKLEGWMPGNEVGEMKTGPTIEKRWIKRDDILALLTRTETKGEK